MEKYSTKQRNQVVKFFYQTQGSIIQTQRTYRRHYRVRDAPSVSAIRTFINRFEEQGAVSDRTRSGRLRTVRTDETREQVRESIEENPGTSTRRRSRQLRISRTSLQRVLRNLNLFPYKVQLVQQLKPKDYQQRLQYAVRIQELARNDRNFTQNLMMTDEAHFHLNGFINKQNCHFWGFENPRSVHQRELHHVKCTVWCGLTADEIIGPYIFEDDHGNAVTVNGERYRTMIENFLRPATQNRRGSSRMGQLLILQKRQCSCYGSALERE
ncbi:hypothetical protein Pcinc_003271 [Petrolisthes cinctipes]|uniref:DUF4817 domain-containing protein n=1 Tax=Petrolisthes cinctipes TaxID=88211 RepID=A0AAE1GHM2_PETCI|nr:hypothetical protein Pcinc_003271 [Petrolisthes cinctipes]